MRRTVSPRDIINFASSELPRKVQLTVEKSEDMEYKDGVLVSSSGTSFVNAKGPIDSSQDGGAAAEFTQFDDDEATYDAESGSNEFYGRGSYSLTLRKCSSESIKLRRDANHSMLLSIFDERLSALDDKGEYCHACEVHTSCHAICI